MIWEKKNIEDALGVSLKASGPFGSIKFNSNDIQPGEIFLALRGVRDGHDFVGAALNNGAALAIVEKEIDGVDPDKLIIVKDSFESLYKLAIYKRNNIGAKFIAITGSVGKTTTKELLKTLLKTYGKTFATQGSFNNHLGVPISLCSVENDTKYVILELGMNAKGEISNLTQLVKPEIALITSVSEGHIEFFEKIEDIADAKSEIFEALESRDSIAIINRDMSMFDRVKNNINYQNASLKYNFGYNQEANFQIIEVDRDEAFNLIIKLKLNEKLYQVKCGAVPKSFAYNIAAALGIISSLGLKLDPAIKALKNFEPLIGRGRLVQTNIRGKKLNIICDYYNANLQSMSSALEYLSELKANSKIAILGQMGELGHKSEFLHQELAKLINKIELKKLILIGPKICKISEQIVDIPFELYETCDAAEINLDDFQDDSLILIKGSRSLKLEEIAKKLGVKNAL